MWRVMVGWRATRERTSASLGSLHGEQDGSGLSEMLGGSASAGTGGIPSLEANTPKTVPLCCSADGSAAASCSSAVKAGLGVITTGLSAELSRSALRVRSVSPSIV